MEIETSNDTSTANPPDQSSPPRPSTSKNKEQFQVERIVDKRIQNNQKLYLIKWEGFPDSECTWEPVENLLSVLDLIVDYEVRDCIKDPNLEEDDQHNEEDPSDNTKRAAKNDLSDEDEPQKKVKTDIDHDQENDNGEEDDDEEDDEEDDDDDDDDEEEEEEESVEGSEEHEDSLAKRNAIDLLRRRKKYLQTLKAFQAEAFLDLETFTEFAKKIKLSNPFKLETIDYQDLELKFPKYGERKALTDVGLKKRGRPKKIIDPDAVAVAVNDDEASLVPKKRGRPSKKLLKLLRKRGRPRKVQSSVDTTQGESEPKKRGRPKKVVEGDPDQPLEHNDETSETQPKEEEPSTTIAEGIVDEEGTEAVLMTQVKKRGRPKKTLTAEEIDLAMEEEKPSEVQEEGEEKLLRRRGRPRKDQSVLPSNAIDVENENENFIQNIDIMVGEGIEIGKIEESEEESEEDERVGDEDYNPLSKGKSKRNALPKQKTHGSETKDQLHEGAQKRGRGRPKKNPEVIKMQEEKKESEHQTGGEPQIDQTEKNYQTESKQDENSQVKQENETATQPEENAENTPVEGHAETFVRKRGRPPKNKGEVSDSQPKRGRGRPPKHASSQQHTNEHSKDESDHHQQTQELNDIEDDLLDLNVPIKRKRGRPRKNVEDIDKENEYNENQSNKDFEFADKTERAVSNSPDFNILAQKPDHQKTSPEPTTTSRAMFYKDGNLEAKDKPKNISKVRIVPGSGCLFLVEWEPRANGEQPKKSYVSSNEFKNYNPVFLLDYYENIIRENLKENGQENLIKSTTEEIIPVEPVPEQYGSLAFHDKPKDVLTIQAINESGCEFLVRWHERFNSEQPLDSLVNSDSFKAHDPSFLLKYYESRLKPKPGNDDAVLIDLPEFTELNKQNENLLEDSLKDMSVFDASNVGIHVGAEFQRDMESSMSNTLTGNE